MSSTIAAIATPLAAGGIGIIRISGENALNIADKVFRCKSGKKLCDAKGYTAHYGRASDENGDIDEAIAIVYRAPKSYTGEDIAEISCHGGLLVVQRVLRSVFAAGASAAGPGEFTKRAFLNGKIDLAEAEGVMDIINAGSEQAANAALNLRDGALSREADDICQNLISASAHMAAWVDYPEDDVPELNYDVLAETLRQCGDRIEKLISRYDSGKAVTEGVSAVIVGKPNAGKSTLMNALAGVQKSIVTPVAGTTRDVVEETVRLGNVVLRLADTAGIRETGDIVESIGVDMAKQRLQRAEIVFAVFDLSDAFTHEDEELCRICESKKSVAILNKSDLDAVMDISQIEKYFSETVTISAESGDNLEALEKAVERVLGTAEFDSSAPMAASERQRDCCRRALQYINEGVEGLNSGVTLDAVNVLADCAIDALLELTGKKAGEEVINEVFSRFCVGK